MDWDNEPLPELPFPNDLAARTDPTSPTGLRLNISTVAETDFQTDNRRKLNELTGFGTYAPITVSFESPLDLAAIASRHPNDLHLPTSFDDDVILVIDVDPDSPHYGEPVPLDVGHGRFPYDVFDADRYFPNDTRAGQPSLLYDTVDEDLDGDGVLDPGEDTDNDGILDIPNVFPAGADPIGGLLTWYERSTDTLIVRPVVPMREETTYAVVLTNRLVGLDGEPVRSPWPYVHHTRQTGALAPLEDVLPAVNLDLDEVAFAWTFTTGRVTGDLRDIRRGLVDGQGPWPHLQAEYPAGVTEALQISDRDDTDPWYMPMEHVVSVLLALGLEDGEGLYILEAGFRNFSGGLVGGAFQTPYLLADQDGDGDDSDEAWRLDAATGELFAEPRRLPFTCVLPKEEFGYAEPFTTMLYGHGYGSSRIESMLFAAVMNRMGIAVCSVDYPGHGPGVSADERAIYEPLLDAAGLLPVLDHVLDSRQRDLDNDGSPDSGGDMWSADAFHTRDMVRQGTVDWIRFAQALGACGSTEMALMDYNSIGQPVDSGGTRMSCDWDNDGTPDIGGPDGLLVAVGGSLGGISTGVAAALIPEISAWASIVPGGGIADVGVRTEIGGGVEAFVGRVVTPLFLGMPQEDGSLEIVQLVNSVTNMVSLPIGTIDHVPIGGSVVIDNLATGEPRTAMMPSDGRFRVGIAADSLDAIEKGNLAGIPATGPEEGIVYTVEDNLGLGDPLRVTVFDSVGEILATFDSWTEDVVIQGVTLKADTPLIAGAKGEGYTRGSSDARRLAGLMVAVLEPGDPIAYASHWFTDPFPEIGTATNVLVMPTAGDFIVPVNTGIALARAAGIYPWDKVDARYGTTIDQWMIEREVLRAIPEWGPWTDVNGDPALFDPDDLDDGLDDFGAPSDVPLRVSVRTEVGVSAMRIPYVSSTGSHGFATPEPSRSWDANTFAIHQVAAYLLDLGQTIRDDHCLESADCADFPPLELPDVE